MKPLDRISVYAVGLALGLLLLAIVVRFIG